MSDKPTAEASHQFPGSVWVTLPGLSTRVLLTNDQARQLRIEVLRATKWADKLLADADRTKKP